MSFRKFLILFLLLAGSALGQGTPLRINNPTTVPIGPFVDSTDFKTRKTGLTATNITCRVVKQSDTTSATSTTFTGAASGSPHDIVEVTSGNGLYNLEIPAADVDTVGRLTLDCTCAATLGTTHDFTVLSEADWQINMLGNVSDNTAMANAVMAALTTLYGANFAFLDAPISSAATSNPALFPQLTNGTAQAGAALTITLSSSESATDNIFKNSYVVIKSGTGADQWALITAYNGTSKVATISCAQTSSGAWLVTPDATSAYSIFAKGR